MHARTKPFCITYTNVYIIYIYIYRYIYNIYVKENILSVPRPAKATMIARSETEATLTLGNMFKG